MATVIRDFLSIFGVKVEDEDLERMGKRVEDLGQRLDKAKGRIADFAGGITNGLTVAVAGANAALTGIIATTTQTAFEMDRMAQSVNFNVESFQAYAAAAKNAGLEAEDLQDIVGTLSERLVDAGVDGPGSDAAQMAKRLGIELRDASGAVKDTETLLLELSDALTRTPAGAERTAIAMTFLGDVGREALPFLEQGSDAIKSQADEMRRLGVVISQDGIERSRQFTERMNRVRAIVTGAAQSIALELLPRVEDLARRFEQWWGEANRVEQITRLLTPALRILGVVAGGIVSAKVLGGFVQLTQVLGSMITILRGVGMAALAAQAKLLLIPAAILAGFILLEDFFVFLQGGDSKIGQFVDNFEESEGPLGMLARALKEIRDIINAEVVPLIPEITRAFSDAWAVVRDELLPIIRLLAKVVGGLLLKAFRRWIKGLVPATKLFADLVKRWVEGIRIIRENVGDLEVDWKGLIRVMLATTTLGMSELVGIVARAFDAIEVDVKSLGTFARDAGKSAAQFLSRAFSLIKDNAAGIWGDFKRIMMEPFVDLAELVTNVFNGILSAWEGVTGFFQRTIDGISRAFEIFGAGIRIVFLKVKEAVLLVASGVVDALEPIFDTIQATIDAANTLGAGIELNVSNVGADFREALASTRTERLGEAARVTELSRQQSIQQNNNTRVEISIGGTNATPGQIQGAVASGVAQGTSAGLERREAARDLQAG